MSRSDALFEASKQVFVGGVNSPVRAFKAVGGHPLFIQRGQGASVITEDDRSLIDYVLSWGPLILGHCHPSVVVAIQKQAAMGTSFGAPTQKELDLANLVQFFFPSMKKIRFVSSGTEATMSALRLARGFTNKSYIVKFEGCYHGHADGLLVSAGSGALTFGQPDSKGVLPEIAEKTIVLPYNDTEALKACFTQYSSEIAAVILEPVCGNMGVVLPTDSFLSTLQNCTQNAGALLIFDEVMTGFRVSPGGAQALFGITPDLTCLGKVIGGGLPCAAFGGREDVMSFLAPDGPVYQGGTLSGNPLAMAAGIATLTVLKDDNGFEAAKKSADQLVMGIQECIRKRNIPAVIQQAGTMFTLFFTPNAPQNLSDVKTCDLNRFNSFFQKMLDQNIYLAPSQYEANFLSSAHHEKEIEETLEAVDHVFGTF